MVLFTTSKAWSWIGRAREALFHLNFYRIHLLYFILVIITSSGILYGSSTSSYSISYIDAIYLCTSAMCNVGLATINLNNLTGFQQSILFVLMFIGDLTVVTISVVIVRRYYISKKISVLLRESAAGRRIAEDIEKQYRAKKKRTEAPKYENGDRSSQQGLLSPVDHSKSHLKGYGSFPAPWDWGIFKNLRRLFKRGNMADFAAQHHYLSFQPKLDHKGRFRSLKPEQQDELGGVEYRALKVLTWMLWAYYAFWFFIILVVLTPYATHTNAAHIIRSDQPGNLSPAWWSVFLTVSAYSNTGLSLLNSSMIPFANDYLILIFTGTAILAGGSMYPVFLRFSIWLLYHSVSRDSELHHSLTFLLHHPRRCYLLLFPSTSTWVLFATQVTINLASWIFWILLNINQPPINPGMPAGQYVMDGLFQAHGVRSSGFYIVNISSIAPALQFLYLMLMYTSAFPLIMSLRQTNVYEERTLGQTDSTRHGNANAAHGTHSAQTSQVGIHIRRQLAYDIWYLGACVFLICIIEHEPLKASESGFSIFSIIFEVISAYGTSGLSLGVPDDHYSFSGTWNVLSKLVLLTVMLRGRHRVLPFAIDRAVLLPGQELMEKLDREFSGSAEEWRDVEERILEEERGEQVERSENQRQEEEE